MLTMSDVEAVGVVPLPHHVRMSFCILQIAKNQDF